MVILLSEIYSGRWLHGQGGQGDHKSASAQLENQELRVDSVQGCRLKETDGGAVAGLNPSVCRHGTRNADVRGQGESGMSQIKGEEIAAGTTHADNDLNRLMMLPCQEWIMSLFQETLPLPQSRVTAGHQRCY